MSASAPVEPSGKNHCGGDDCDKDAYSEDRCDCACETRCGPWNIYLDEKEADDATLTEARMTLRQFRARLDVPLYSLKPASDAKPLTGLATLTLVVAHALANESMCLQTAKGATSRDKQALLDMAAGWRRIAERLVELATERLKEGEDDFESTRRWLVEIAETERDKFCERVAIGTGELWNRLRHDVEVWHRKDDKPDTPGIVLLQPKEERSDDDEGWHDRPLPEDAAIREAHPTKTDRHELYGEAMRLVGAKRSKKALVELVNWLLYKEALGAEEIGRLKDDARCMRCQRKMYTPAHCQDCIEEERNPP